MEKQHQQQAQQAHAAAAAAAAQHSQALQQAAAAAAAASSSSSAADQSPHLVSPHGSGRKTPRNFENSALRQLPDFTRPHSNFSPFQHPNLPPHLQPGSIPPGLSGLTGAGPVSPFEQYSLHMQMMKEAEEGKKALEKQQKELEMKSRQSSGPSASGSGNSSSGGPPATQGQPPLPPTSSSSMNFDPQILEIQRRIAAGTNNAAAAAGVPCQPPSLTNPPTSTANGLNMSSLQNPAAAAAAAAATGLPFLSFMPPGTDPRAAEAQLMAAHQFATMDNMRLQERMVLDSLRMGQMGINPADFNALAHAASAASAAAAAAGHPGFPHPSGKNNFHKFSRIFFHTKFCIFICFRRSSTSKRTSTYVCSSGCTGSSCPSC